MNATTMMYVIDKNYKILYVNDEFKKYYPQIACGQTCYKALENRHKICEHCPKLQDNNENIFYSDTSKKWIKSQILKIEWEGNPDCYAVVFKVWNGRKEDDAQVRKDERNSVIEDILLASDNMAKELKQAQFELVERNKTLKKQNELLKYFSM